MLKNIIKQSYIWIIIIGIFSIAPIMLGLNQDYTVISKESISYGSYTWTYYKFNLPQYLQNLQYSINLNQLANIFPNWPKLPEVNQNTWDVLAQLKYLTNTIIIYSLNVMITLLTIIILAPLKILFYPANIMLTILGINTQHTDFIRAMQTIYTFNIPNIPYIS